MLDTVIPEASAFKVALSCRTPVGIYSPRTPAARLTDQLAGELMNRIAARYARQHVA